LGKLLKTIATSASFSLLLYCLGCGNSLQQAATQQPSSAATPNITQVLPQVIPAGSQATTLKVTGTNFPSQAAILWNGTAVKTTAVDANTLTGTIGSSSLATPATVQLKVQNTQTMEVSAPAQVTITDPNAAPPSALTLSIATLPQGVVGAPYSGTFSVAGGVSPYIWNVASGQLPPGLSVEASTGIISGTPTSAGNYSFAIKVTDSSSLVQSATTTVSLPVITAPAAPTALTITSSSLPSGTIGSAYSTVLQSSGGTAPSTWSFISGNLPAGLSLNTSTGLISGTPTAVGTASFTVAVVDSSSPAQSKSITLSIVIAPLSLAITTSAVPAGTVGTSYATVLQASGGAAPYTWSISSGSLPAGLSLIPSLGIISGTPTAAGTVNFTATVADEGNPIQTKSVGLSLAVAPAALTITSSALSAGTQNANYSSGLQAVGGTAPYTWSISSGSLSAVGLSLAASTGVVSGTPTRNGNFSFGVTVKDGGSPAQTATGTVTLSLVQAGAALAITTTALPGGVPNTNYSATLNATGGTGPYTWSLTSTSSSLPNGLGLVASTGIISGQPTTSSSTSLTFKVTDSSGTAQTMPVPLTLAVAPLPLAITTSSLPSGVSGTRYSNLLQASGGTPSYTWSVTKGSLPAGLKLASATGLISGTPAPGTSSFTVTVKDAGSPAPQTQQANLSITITAPAPPPLTVSTSSLPSGTITASYSNALQAAGGTSPYTWSITSGALPAGLTLASNGLVSGTPTTSGNFSIGVTVQDAGSPAQSTTATLALSIAAAAGPLAISTTSLSPGIANASFSTSLNATGGTTPYTWSITSGTLPAGLSLAAASGTISGTPTTAGTASLTFKVADSSSPLQTKSVTLSLAITTQQLTITTTSLPSGTNGVTYSSPMTSTGGTPAYTWSVTVGALPAGLTMATATGIISGTPTTNGTYNFTATVADNGTPVQTASAATSIVVAAAQPSGPGTTWYVRPDGGTRYSSNVPSGQCNGRFDASYASTGGSPTNLLTNQNCAFKDFRYMWDDESGAVGAGTWVIAGGDTVIIRGCTASANQSSASNPDCRLGWDAPTGTGANLWCYGVGPYTCYNPPIPAGTALQHTRILGQNYGACNVGGATNPKQYASNLTQLFGGFGLSSTFNLQDTQYVDVQCIELTTHNGQCTRGGSPSYPRYCSSDQPLDDYAQNGFITNNTTSNVTLQDVYVHGFNSSGFYGPIGGPITMTRVFSGFNAFAGWNFDDGGPTPNGAGSSITASYVTMVGNGCYEEYPIVHTGYPARACYDPSSGGFGDSWSGQDSLMDSFVCDHCVMAYNTKDGFIGPHVQIGTLTITNSASYGNMGQQWKWDQASGGTLLFQNNLTVGNCLRMSDTLPGAAQNFNQSTGLGGSYLTNFCRAAGDTLSVATQIGASAKFYGNTFIFAGPTGLDFNCGTSFAPNAGNCGAVPIVFQGNNFLGYTDPAFGTGEAPGLFYKSDSSINFTSSYNSEYGIRNGDSCTGNILCSSPLLVNQPAQPWPGSQAALDVFNPTATGSSFYPTTGSPLIGAWTPITALTTDYYGVTRPDHPTIGAVEP
jgi:hypothetical protein